MTVFFQLMILRKTHTLHTPTAANSLSDHLKSGHT
jgi:hypothetical protein